MDPGKEFMGETTTRLRKHGVTIEGSKAGNHQAQAFVEMANRTLAECLFSHHHAQEMLHDGRLAEWVKRLPAVLDSMNREPTHLTGREPEVKRWAFNPSNTSDLLD